MTARSETRRRMSVIKYQVFVSSTYEDLKDERTAVIKAVLEMGHIPVGMEMFSAADEEQWKVIARQIDQSDYYIVLIAHRYGSMAEDISYTEKEYDYAVAQGVPILGFVIKDGASWPADRIEQDRRKTKKFLGFKAKIKSKPVDFWSSPDELRGKVAIALMKAANTNPRPGWIRASVGSGPEVLKEISRLSAENAALRERLELAKGNTEREEIAERQRIRSIMHRKKISLSFWHKGATTWTEGTPTSLLIIFQIIAPGLLVEEHLEQLTSLVAIAFVAPSKLRVPWPIPSNQMQILLADLQALGLISPSPRKHPIADGNQYWALSQGGQDMHKFLRRLELDKLSKNPAESAGSTPGAIQATSTSE